MDTKRKIIVLCPVRNEEENLKRFIPAWQLFADYIVIADQHSDDNTRQVAEQFSNVFIVDNPEREYHEGRRNAILINKAREITQEGIFVYLDADETLSANILDSPEWRVFCKEPPGTAGKFNWIVFWDSTWEYFGEGPHVFSFIDDGREVNSSEEIHSERGLGQVSFSRNFYFNEVVNLHFACVPKEAGLRKNNWYKVYYIVKGKNSYYRVNYSHKAYFSSGIKKLRPSKPHWLQGFTTRGIDVTSRVIDDLYWFEIDILRWFKLFGEKKFFFLDIWIYVDWEKKRKLALLKGIEGISEKPIKRPNRLIYFYHFLCSYDFSLREWVNKIKHLFLRGILP